MDILLFGGAFDPVHNAHCNNLRQVLKHRSFDKVIIMPTGTPGHKSNCKVPFRIRKKMAETAFSKVCDNIEVSSFEGDSFQRSYSYITVDYLKQTYPGAKIYFLIGADSALTMKMWKNWQYLAENVTFIVLDRENGQRDEVDTAVDEIRVYSKDTYVLHIKPMPLSSTQVRELAAQGADITSLVDEDVAEIIHKYSLYSSDFYKRNIGTAKMLIPLLLRKKRATHTKNVADLARDFAKKYGENPDKAYLAGLLHDIQKEVEPDVLLHRAINAGDEETIKSKPLPVLHGFAAADFVQNEMGVDDEDLLWRLKSHTCGRPGMSTLEKIVYLADMLSRERDYPEKQRLLDLAWQDLDICMERALSDSLKWIEHRGGALDNDTVSAYNYFKLLNEKNGKKTPD